jgi:hypothetical protein
LQSDCELITHQPLSDFATILNDSEAIKAKSQRFLSDCKAKAQRLRSGEAIASRFFAKRQRNDRKTILQRLRKYFSSTAKRLGNDYTTIAKG